MNDLAERVAQDFAETLQDFGNAGLYEFEWVARGMEPQMSPGALRETALLAYRLVSSRMHLHYEKVAWLNSHGVHLNEADFQDDWLDLDQAHGTYVDVSIDSTRPQAASG